MNRRVLILTTESLPPWPSPTAGGGVRAWSLGEALDEAGVQVTYLIPKKLCTQPEGWDPLKVITFENHELDNVLKSQQDADVLIVEQWQPLTLLQSPPPLPTLVDLPGPLFLEYVWREPAQLPRHYADKIRCLSYADGLLTACPEQRGYALAWAAAAGLNLHEFPIRTVPFCMPAMPPARQGARGEPASILSAGIFWPWQKMEESLRIILGCLQTVGAGRLVIVGGCHPHHQDAPQPVEAEEESHPWLPEDIANHPRAAHLGLLTFSELVEEIRRSTVSVDLGAQTVERELALAVRTGVALWVGCPIMVRPWSLWAPLIEKHNAGWIIEDIESKDFKNLIEGLARGQVDVISKRRGAAELAQTHMIPSQCIRPLLDWIQSPPRRMENTPLLDERFRQLDNERLELRRELDSVAHEFQRASHDLESIRNNPLFRLYKRMQGLLGNS